ncbi:MAG: cyanophycin synthetase [bacterium]|nr:cyanophycin synthetase [bacterium]
MKKGYSKPLLGQLIQKIAPRIGARIVIEPEWNIVGQVIYKSGKKRYFKYSSLDLNTQAASEIAKDKGYSDFFMKMMGYPTIDGKVFFSDKWARAIGSKDNLNASYRYAKKLGFPLIVKPNSGSQGVGVALVYNKREFYRAMRFIFEGDRVALVQKYICGRDYRVVVLDNRVISAYERIPLNVIGDGKSTILALLKKKQKTFQKSGRDTMIRLDDARISQKLSHAGLSFNSIPKADEQIFLLDNANLSTGGDSLDVTDKIHPDFQNFAIKLTSDMGLRLCGVDLMIDDDVSRPAREAKNYWIIEINSAPGLDHYIKIGREQQKIVENLYLKVLRGMER